MSTITDIFDALGRHERPDGLHWDEEHGKLRPSGYGLNWACIRKEATLLGYFVSESHGYIHIDDGKNEASFMNCDIGIAAAWEFLRGEA